MSADGLDEVLDVLRTGRAELIRRIQDLVSILRSEREDRRRDARDLLDNLTATQTRCTELLLELREARAGLLLPGWSCRTCKGFNGEAKERIDACRACGTARPQ